MDVLDEVPLRLRDGCGKKKCPPDQYVNLTGADWAGLAGVVVGGVGGVLKSQNDLKATQAQANALNNQSAAGVEIARINALTAQTLASAGGAKTTTTKKGLSTGAIAGIAIGAIVVVGAIIYAVTRK
jgi:hypothetical protein